MKIEISEPMHALISTIVFTAVLLIATDARSGSGSPEPYPEIPSIYQPDLPSEYTYPEYAQDIHNESAFSVTLKNREKLWDAALRLKGKSDGIGGRILVPSGVDTIQCDDLWMGRKKIAMDNLTIEGVIDETGYRPRFYCRRIKAGGTIPKGEAGPFLVGGATQSTMIKNIEVDGYAKFWQIANAPHAIVKNSYFHNSTGDGFTSSNISTDDPTTDDRLIVFAGVEISHAGNGNTKHCMYIHRSNKPDVAVKLVVMDSTIYSCNWSSGIKTIANENTIVNNTFWKFWDAIDSEGRMAFQPRKYTHSMIDAASCSRTVISGNTFNDNVPAAGEKTPAGPIIGSRNRKSIYGCDSPPAWVTGIVRLADGSKHQCARNPLIPECELPESDAWKDSYWQGLDKTKTFPMIINHNVFNLEGGERTKVIGANGMYPNYTYTLGGWACPLPVNPHWYDRSLIYLTNNTYIGITGPWKNNTFEVAPAGWGNDKCLTPPPEKDLRCPDTGCRFFEFGEGETFSLYPPADWRKGAKDEPVIKSGDFIPDAHWGDPSVIKEDDGYVMYLSSSTVNEYLPPIVPFRAESTDGINWALNPTTPLLSVTDTGCVNNETPSVVKFKGKYHMYYSCVYEQGVVPAMSVGHATSVDGISWVNELTPVITATGNPQQWNGYLVAEPAAVVFNNKMYLYFTAMGARVGNNPPQLQSIGVATSSDGVTFDAQRQVLTQGAMYPPEEGYVGYSTPTALTHNGKIHLMYDVARFKSDAPRPWHQMAIHHAVSDDGFTDFREDDTAVFTREDFPWTADEMLAPSLLLTDDTAKLWWGGHANYLLGIGYAEIPINDFLRGE